MSQSPEPGGRRFDVSARSTQVTIAVVAVIVVALVAWVGIAVSRSGSTPGTAGGPTTAPPSTPAPTDTPSGSTSTTAPSGGAKDYIVGVMSRSGPPKEAMLTFDGKPLVSGFVIPVDWKDLQPNGPGDLDTSQIDSQLAFAKEHSLPVRLRVNAGVNSPAWVLQQAGKVSWTGTPDENGPGAYDIPKFWTPTFQQLFAALDKKLAAKYDSVPEVREVDLGMCTTNYAEPFIRQFSAKGNATTARASGYSDALNNQCIDRTIDTFKADWPTTNFAMAFNPYQSVDDTTPSDKTAQSAAASITQPEKTARYCLATLGKRCVLGNDSMKGTSRGPSYDALYAMLKSLKAPVYIQTAADKRIGGWEAALQNAVDTGALSVELAAGYQRYDRATLQSFNDKLAANAQALQG